MSYWQQVLEVARWEFARFVKWKQQLIGLAVMLALGVGGGVVGRAVKRAELKPVPVAVVGGERLDFALPDAAPVRWDSSRAWTEDSARAAVADERLRGALLVRDAQRVELVIRSQSEWSETLQGTLVSARQAALVARVAAASPDGAALLAPLELRTQLLDVGAKRSSKSTRVAAIVILLLSFTLVLGGFGTLFAGITGEKQHRVTEQLVAIVPPQAWMDGKLLGLAAASMTGTALTTLGILALARFLPGALGVGAISMPDVASDLPLLLLILGISLLGALLWFAFMAAVAATIDDPNSSMRTLLMFVPMLPISAAFLLVTKLETSLAQALAIFPLTSSAVLPMRLVVTTVPWWEIVLAVLLLVGSVWLFRRLAGKIFGTAVLMYGKEPSVAEIIRWMRRA